MSKEKSHTPKDAAPLDKRVHFTTGSGKATLVEQACIHLLNNGAMGTSRVSASHGYGDFDFRNQISILRNKHGVEVVSELFPYLRADGGVSHLSRYSLPNKVEAGKVAALANLKRKKRGAVPFAREQVDKWLKAFPDSEGEA